MCIIIAMQHYFFWFLEWYAPRDEIEYVQDEWHHGSYEKVRFYNPAVYASSMELLRGEADYSRLCGQTCGMFSSDDRPIARGPCWWIRCQGGSIM
jgi:hypothetical protein